MIKMALAALTLLFAATAESAQDHSSTDLANRMIERRAVETVIWGMPAVNFDLLYQAMAQAKVSWNEVVYWSRLPDWKNQTLTPNPDVIYVFPFFDTRDVGPMVMKIPPAGPDGSITGSVDDAWQTALKTPTARSTSISAPKAPAGKDANWVPTNPAGKFEVLFRLYGPEKPFFDKVWVLPDIEKVN